MPDTEMLICFDTESVSVLKLKPEKYKYDKTKFTSENVVENIFRQIFISILFRFIFLQSNRLMV